MQNYFLPGVIVIGITLYVIAVYNSLQQLKTQIRASIQEIGNQLKRQASLIPNLEVATKGYLKHEKDVFKMLTDARKKIAQAEKTGAASDVEKAIESVQAAIPSLNVAVESNPELKADKTITKFMDELTDTADKLMYSRRSVIDLSQAYNVKLVTFPSSVIANLFHFGPEKGLETAMSGPHLEVNTEEMKDTRVTL